MRVGVDGAPLSIRRTGVGRYVAELLRASAAGGVCEFDVLRFQPRRGIEMASIEDLESPGLRLRTASRPMSMVVSLAASYDRPFPLDLVLGRPEAMLFTRYWQGSLLSPSVTFIYDLVCKFAPETVDEVYLPRLNRAVSGSIRRSDRIAVISRTVEKEVHETFPDTIGRTLVVPPGITPFPARTPTQDQNALRRLNLTPGYFLTVGTIEPRKNIVRLAQAFTRLSPETRLVLVGNEGWATGPLVDAFRALGPRCRWLRDLPDGDLGSVYRGARALVFPSLYEGFGLPLLEAIDAGVSIVCSDIPIFREVLTGRSAVFFDPLDVNSMVESLISVAQAPGPVEGFTQRWNGANKYSWHNSASTLTRSLSELASRI